jgi:hypothetical protein
MDAAAGRDGGATVNADAVELGLAGLALAVLPPRSRSPSPLRRLRDIVPRTQRQRRPAARRPDSRKALALLAWAAVTGLVGPPAGLLVGAVAGWAAWRAACRSDRAAGRRRRQRLGSELPSVLDLLAVCLRAGLPVGQALAVVTAALPGEVTRQLRRVATLYELGAGAAAWDEVRADSVLGPVARAAVRSGESGAALASDFERLAAEHRDQTSLDATVHTQRTALVALAPLGLCFLPAFVCLGVVPVVLSVAHQVLGGLD